MTRSAHPEPTEHPPYYEKYISQVPQGDIVTVLEQELDAALALLNGIPTAKADFRYAPGKWTVKESIGHVIDCERVYAYRALRFARNDKKPLPGISPDDDMPYAKFADRELAGLISEFTHVRLASIDLFRHLEPAAWDRRGIASDMEFTVRAMAYITAGHEIHHREILKTRYLA